MLVTFKSKASSDITMLSDLAGYLLSLIGKKWEPSEPQGVISLEEIPFAIQRLETAIQEDHIAVQQQAEYDHPHDEEAQEEEIQVQLAQRAYPLLELLRAAQKNQCTVLWGV